ncbi:hypothetical protein ACSSV4_001026 [Roseovarius sp. MBR-154]
MKTRWLKSVVTHSKRPAPALPYHRRARARAAPRVHDTGEGRQFGLSLGCSRASERCGQACDDPAPPALPPPRSSKAYA